MRQKAPVSNMLRALFMLLMFMQLFTSMALAAVDMSASRGDVASYVGSFNHTIPIGVAPGRAGMQPALALQYSSSVGNGLYGYGWNLDVTRIELNTKMGAPKYNVTDTYLLVMKGARQALVHVGGNEYRVANESAFLKITKTSNGWTIRDQKNTRYDLNAPWPMTGPKIFRWSLSGVVDVKNNSISYFYADGGQGHRLTQIQYAPNNKVVFAYEARPDSILSFRSGHRSNINLRLKSVESYAGARLAGHTGFTYAPAGVLDSRSMLSRATVFDVDGLLPSRSTVFEYTQQKQSAATGEWDAPRFVTTKSGIGRQYLTATKAYLDVNGDGVSEIVSRGARGGIRKLSPSFKPPFVLPDEGIVSYSYSQRTIRPKPPITVQVFDKAPLFYPLNAVKYYADRAIIDINGDGFMDWMFRDNAGVWRIYFHNGTALNREPERWNDPSGALHGHALYDVNGDGLPDLLHSKNIGWTSSSWTVYQNTGSGFATQGYSASLSMPPFARAGLNQFMGRTMNTIMPAILSHQPWNSKPLMTKVTDQASGASKQVAYTLQGGIANAPKLKLWTVNKITTSSVSNNVEVRSSSYSYSGGLYVLSKQEFRGFKTAVQTDDQTAIKTSTTYNQSLIFQGRPSQVSTSLNGTTLSLATTTWAAKDLSNGKGTRQFPYPSTVRQISYDLNGALLSDSTTQSGATDYDMFGHLLKSTTTNTNGFTKTLINSYSDSDTCAPIVTTVTKQRLVKNGIPAYIRNSYYYKMFTAWKRHWHPWYRNYANNYFARLNSYNWGSHWENYQVTTSVPDTTCWKVRQLLRADVTSSTPADPVSGAPADRKTRSSSFAYDASGFLTTETIEPGTAVSQQTTYAYDRFGQIW